MDGATTRALTKAGLAALFLALPAGARAEPALTAGLRETADVWSNLDGGVRSGGAVMSKLQLLATVHGDAAGLTGFKAHLQAFLVNGTSLSDKVGDLQTVSNLEAPDAARLFEAWVEQEIGREDHGGGSLRAGLLDLNAEFDSIDDAGLFLNASHGIGPDLSSSGLNGPSIYPVSSLAVRGEWAPSPALALRVAAFEGVPGDPGRPRTFVVVRLRSADGALLIGQADLKPAKGWQLSLGAWKYTAAFDQIGAPGRRRQGPGVYGFLEAPLPGGEWNGWIRAGRADSSVQAISGYLGAGIAGPVPIRSREDDQLGFAVARAIIGAPARRLGLPAAETTLEAAWQAQISKRLYLQPDVQYVIHPASRPNLPNAFVVGLRLSVTASVPGVASEEVP